MAVVAVIVALAPLRGQNSTRPEIEIVDGREVVRGEAIVRFRTGASSAQVFSALDLDENRALANGVRRIRSRGSRTDQLLAALAARPDVASAEPNFVVRTTKLPNDPYFPAQSWLLNRRRAGSDIHAPGAWEITSGTPTTVVALIDTGADYRHPDLAPNIWSAPAPFTVTLGGVSVTCPAGTHGFDTLRMSCDPMDDNGHGTAMAGVVGAVGNNGMGVAGVAWRTSLMPIKFLGADGWGSYADAINAIEFAIQVKTAFAAGGANIRIVSNSWGGNGFSQALSDQIARAADHDMLVVASAGNDSSDNDFAPKYPGSLTSPNIIAVAALTDADTLQPYSNWGTTSVDLGAPAATLSTGIGIGYVDTGGTSAAAAVVSGAAALVLSSCRLTTAALKQTLLSTADPVPALSAVTVAGGRVNVEDALNACRRGNTPPVLTLISPADQARVVAPATMAVLADAHDAEGNIARVDFYAGNQWIGRDVSPPYTITWTARTAGNHVLSAVATDAHGASAASSVTVTATAADPDISLPSGWHTQDVGEVGHTGAASFAGTTFTVQGAGADVWGAADQFRFVYQTLSGDGQIVARVRTLENVAPWTKAGVMIRQSLSPDAAHAFMLVSAGKGSAFQRRNLQGGSSTGTSGGVGTAPRWVKLVRSGQTITASTSGDGVRWTVVGRDTLSLGASAYVGLAVSSHDPSLLATATFDSVLVTRTAPAPLGDGWSNADVGTVGVKGSATGSNGSYAVTGGGADVWGTADAFHFVYRTLAGDGQIVARVASVDGPSVWTKAGVMMRSAVDPSAAHAFMLVSPGKGLAFQRRVTTGSVSASTPAGSGAAPVWLKLVRAGQLFSAYRSADGVVWTPVGSNVISASGALHVGVAVSSHDPTRPATARFDNVAVTAAALLPAGWETEDVGAVGPAGSASYANGSFMVRGGGADIWGPADAFHFTHTTLTGDGEIVARLQSLSAVHAWTKAGVMIRESLAPGSPHALMLVASGKGTAFQRRVSTNGPTAHTTGPGGAAPRWVKLVRAGARITASTSSDGSTWTTVGYDTYTMGRTVHIGLAVSSHDTTRLAAATFTGVAVTPSP